jgi:DNA-binding transcriptional ArsR family regulator
VNVVSGVPSRPLQYAKAIRESDLLSGTSAVWWAVATYANNRTGIAYPTVTTLAKATGLSEPTVSRHTRLAEAKGYLLKDRRMDSSIKYTITVPKADELPGTSEPDDLTTGGVGHPSRPAGATREGPPRGSRKAARHPWTVALPASRKSFPGTRKYRSLTTLAFDPRENYLNGTTPPDRAARAELSVMTLALRARSPGRL